MSDKIVTHEDLSALRELRDDLDRKGALPTGTALPLLDRLIAAAEADRPRLPEGWVIYTDRVGVQRILWHEGGKFYNWSDCSHEFTIRADHRSLTPLRPTVTDADVEKAARAARAAYFDGADHWNKARRLVRDEWNKTIRAAFKAAGIEVTP